MFGSSSAGAGLAATARALRQDAEEAKESEVASLHRIRDPARSATLGSPYAHSRSGLQGSQQHGPSALHAAAELGATQAAGFAQTLSPSRLQVVQPAPHDAQGWPLLQLGRTGAHDASAEARAASGDPMDGSFSKETAAAGGNPMDGSFSRETAGAVAVRAAMLKADLRGTAQQLALRD